MVWPGIFKKWFVLNGIFYDCTLKQFDLTGIKVYCAIIYTAICRILFCQIKQGSICIRS